MGEQYHSQQSETMINVSHRDNQSQSSSPVSKVAESVSGRSSDLHNEDGDTVQVQRTVEDRVEDSFQPPGVNAAPDGDDAASPEANKSPKLPPRQPNDHDSEDLYGLSPKGQSQHESAKAARQSASKVQASTSGDRDGNAGFQAAQPMPQHAAVRPRTRQQQESKTNVSARASAATDAPRPQASRDQTQAHPDVVVPSSSGPKPQRRVDPGKQSKSGVGARARPTENASSTAVGRPVRAAKQSALQALKARRGLGDNESENEEDPASSRIILAQPKGPQPKPAATKNAARKPKQLLTPITGGASSRNDPRPGTGKLPTHQSRSQGNLAGKGAQRVNEASRSPDSAKGDRGDSKLSSRPPGSLKRPAKKNQAAELREQQRAALHAADASVEPRGASGSRGKALKRPARDFDNRAPVTRERSDTYDPATPGRRRQGRSASRAIKAYSVRTNIGGRTRQRMQATSEQKVTKCSSPPPPDHDKNQDFREEISPPAAELITDEHHREHGNTLNASVTAQSVDLNDGTVIADVPNKRINMDRHEESAEKDASMVEAGLTATAPAQDADNLGKTNLQVSDIDGTNMPTSAAVRAFDRRRPLPDRNARTIMQSRPQTPGFRSNPPGSDAQSRLVPDSTKPNLIGFGKKGPVNQGTSRLSAPGSVQTTRTIMHNTGIFTNKEAPSSRRNLKAHNAQSWAGKARDATRINHTVQPNVAQNGEDVFGAFTFGGRHLSLAKSPNQARRHAPASQDLSEGANDSVPDNEFTVIDDLEGTTFVDAGPPATTREEPSLLQLAMPPPGGKAAAANASPSHGEIPLATDVLAERAAARSSSKQPYITNMDTQEDLGRLPSLTGRKRGLEITAPEERSSKREKPSETHTSTIVPTVVDKGNSSNAAARIIAGKQRERREKPVPPEPVKRVLRGYQKAPRQASQGSVDITGSPYPKTLDVPKLSTALEVFSQQAGLSSDHDLGHKARSSADEELPKENVLLRPPLAQSEILSSNNKPLPAPPEAASQAICRMTSGEAAVKLLIRDKGREPPTDPFTSSEEQRHDSDQAGKETDFLRTLRMRALSGQSRAGLDQAQIAADDPEKTLVEPEPVLTRPSRKNARAISISSESSSDSSLQSEKSSEDEDVVAWRSALKPHQADLFDSLVVVSHKLVRHLVDRETATNDIIADYRRTGERILSSMETSNAALFKDQAKALAERKKLMRKQMKVISADLHDEVDEMRIARPDVNGKRKDRGSLEGALQTMLASYV